MGKKMMHIGLEPGAVGRYVFLPGSPERTEKIAAYFDDPKEIAYNREFRTFVGGNRLCPYIRMPVHRDEGGEDCPAG